MTPEDIAAIPDPVDRARAAARWIYEARREIAAMCVERDRAIRELASRGMKNPNIADALADLVSPVSVGTVKAARTARRRPA